MMVYTMKNLFIKEKIVFIHPLLSSVKYVVVQKRIYNAVKHLRWTFFATIINGFQPLTIFAKKLHCSCPTGFSKHLCSTGTLMFYLHIMESKQPPGGVL